MELSRSDASIIGAGTPLASVTDRGLFREKLARQAAPDDAYRRSPPSPALTPPLYELRMWTPSDGRTSLAWFTARNSANVAAALLRVGAGGRYPFAETLGPALPGRLGA